MTRDREIPGLLPPRAAKVSELDASYIRGMSTGEVAFAQRWATIPGAPGLQTQLSFHPRRRWRFDLANLSAKVAIEIDGGAWGVKLKSGRRIQGAHFTGGGATNDREKDFEAILLGWVVFRLTPGMLRGRHGGWSRLNRIAAFIRGRLQP